MRQPPPTQTHQPVGKRHSLLLVYNKGNQRQDEGTAHSQAHSQANRERPVISGVGARAVRHCCDRLLLLEREGLFHTPCKAARAASVSEGWCELQGRQGVRGNGGKRSTGSCRKCLDARTRALAWACMDKAFINIP